MALSFLVAGPTFQPSEIAKVAVILFAARLSKRDTERKKFTNRTLTGRTLNGWSASDFWSWCLTAQCFPLVLVLVVMEPHMSGTILIMVGAAAVLLHQASIWDGS